MSRIVLLVEGQTEKLVLPPFFSRWLEPQMEGPPEIYALNFKGSGDYHKNYVQRAVRELRSDDCIGVIGLLDLYGSGLDYPPGASPSEKHDWAKRTLESAVDLNRFRQHFAVHETEAWLLSDPAIFPGTVREGLPAADPEDVDFDDHPATRLARLFWAELRRKYRKTVEGYDLFSRLDPDLAASKCPHLKLLLDDLLKLAQGTR